MTSQDSQPFRWHFNEFDDQNFQIRGRTLFSVAVLVASVIMIVLLVLYTRWFCRSYVHWNVSPSPGLPHAPPSQGLEPSVISGFPIELHSSKNSRGVGESECVICLGVYVDGEKVKVLPVCGHCYHSECVDKWLSGQSSCPICRSSLRVDSPV